MDPRHLEPLASYLNDPHANGIQCARISVERRAISKFRDRFHFDTDRLVELRRANIARAPGVPTSLPEGHLRKLLQHVKTGLMEQEELRTKDLSSLKPVLQWAEFVRRRGSVDPLIQRPDLAGSTFDGQ